MAQWTCLTHAFDGVSCSGTEAECWVVQYTTAATEPPCPCWMCEAGRAEQSQWR